MDVGSSLMANVKGRQQPTVLMQVKISPQAARLLRARARADLRTQAGYVRNLIYRDLGLI